MVKGSIHPQNITMLDVTMLTVELKIHAAKKDRTAGETDKSTITVRDVSIPTQYWDKRTEKHA